MKAKLIFSIISLIVYVSLYAQEPTKLTKVFLQDGTTFNAYVEKQADGGYKLTTEDGSVFLFRENEISLDKPFKKSARKANSSVQGQENKQLTSQGQLKNIPVQGTMYRDLKKYYSARDYIGREPGDKFSPVGIGIGSFFIPGLGQYITGCQVGWGILQSVVSVYSLGFGVTSIISGYPEIGAPLLLVWAGMGVWSACSASKAAKIMNLYYRDLRNSVTYKFDVAPYIDVTSPVLASNQNMVAGLSFRVSF